MVCRKLLIAGAVLVFAGCGEKGPPTGTVRGCVLVGGKPPAQPIRVQFINSLIGQGAHGMTDAEGSYVLNQPIRVDEYTVYFEKIVDYSQGPVSTSQEVLNEVPKEYRSEHSSPLKRQVNEGANSIDIDLPRPAGK